MFVGFWRLQFTIGHCKNPGVNEIPKRRSRKILETDSRSFIMNNDWGGRRPGAGRPKGSRNRDTVLVQETLDRLGCSPLEVLAAIALDDQQKLNINESVGVTARLKAASTLAEYLYPRRRAVEATFAQDQSLLEVLNAIAEASNAEEMTEGPT